MLGLLPLFALNELFSALFKKKTALLLTNQNGEFFIMYVIKVSKEVDIMTRLLGIVTILNYMLAFPNHH